MPNLTFERGQLLVESPCAITNISDLNEYHPEKVDWLCAAIRRALTKMGWYWRLEADSLSCLCMGIDSMTSTSDLGGHLAAIRYVIEQSEVTK